MIVELVSVGTEILLGNILNTNAQYLSNVCAELGYDVFHIVTVGDNAVRLREDIDRAIQRSDIVIVNGGLGSTADDITKEVVSQYVGREMVVDPETKKRIEDWFRQDSRAVPIDKDNYSFPSGSTIFHNQEGTASGAWIPYKGKVFVILPGPPREMKPMVEKYLIPMMREKQEFTTRSEIIKIGILGEYQICQKLGKVMETSLHPTYATYVKEDGPLLRLTAKGHTVKEVEEELERGYAYVEEKLSSYIIGRGMTAREDILVQLLARRGETVSCAESITGGEVASTLINTAGASEVLKESFIVYSDQAKHQLLGVSEESLQKYSAVSREVCHEMLKGLKEKTSADLCLATTGYAGPSGDPVGLVYVGWSYHGKEEISELHFSGSRRLVRWLSRNQMIDRAILSLKKEEKDGKSYQLL